MLFCSWHCENLVSHRHGVAHCPVLGCDYAVEVTCPECGKPVPMQRLMMGWKACSRDCASTVGTKMWYEPNEIRRMRVWHHRCAELDKRFMQALRRRDG